ncbi:MAG: acetate/propionate family kinase [Candidatus Woesearchaeota archaeon]
MQLVLNAGSSSLKFSLFRSSTSESAFLSGSFDRLGTSACSLRIGSSSQEVVASSVSEAVSVLAEVLVSRRVCSCDEVSSVVHRVVHGGERFSEPVLIDESVLEGVASFSVLAPLHNPVNIEGVRACQEMFSRARHVAVFDTSFHHTIAKSVFLYGVPYSLYEDHGIRKYGFHGISHSFIASELASLRKEPVDAIIAHLGSGSSLTAVKGGVSVDTTMGFSPLDGVLMGTRSGELDPEIPLFLLKHAHYSVDDLERLFSKESGLLGLTGHSDLRDVWSAAKRGSSRDQLALEMLSYRIAYFVNALRTAVTPQYLVFTAGIGEGAWYVRERVCEYLGVGIDHEANLAHEQVISLPEQEFEVLVLRTDEQLQMHRLAEPVLREYLLKE